MTRINKRALLVGALSALIVVSACGGSSSDETKSTTTATGKPIKVGFLNQGAGAQAFVDFGTGGTRGAEQVNADGGINGRPIDLVVCNTDGTPAASVKCANKFVGDKVVAVVQGIDLSSDSALKVLSGAGIPMLGHAQYGVEQANSPDAFFFGAATGAYYGVPLATLKERFDVKKVAFVNLDTPASRGLSEAYLDPAAQRLGIDLEKIFYSPTSPNYNAAFASAAAGKPDAVFIIAGEADCTGLIQAGRALGYKGKIFAGSCSQFIAADPSSAEGVLTDTDLYVFGGAGKIPTKKAEQVKTFEQATKDEPAANVDGLTQMSFSTVMDLATAMRTVEGDVSTTSLKTALGQISNLDSFMGQPLTCDGKQWPNAISVCSSGLLVYEVKDGKRALLSDEFVDASQYYTN